MPGKAKQDPKKSQQQEIAEKKESFLEYYEDLPIKQAAADHINRSLDTISKWETSDPEFAEAVLRAKADYARKHGKKRPDNLLPKLYPELKPDAITLELPTAITITHVHALNQLPADPEAGSGVSIPDRPDHN